MIALDLVASYCRLNASPRRGRVPEREAYSGSIQANYAPTVLPLES